MSIHLMDERMLRIVYTTFTQLSDAYFMLLSIPVFFFSPRLYEVRLYTLMYVVL